jgi:hypothetical protein
MRIREVVDPRNVWWSADQIERLPQPCHPVDVGRTPRDCVGARRSDQRAVTNQCDRKLHTPALGPPQRTGTRRQKGVNYPTARAFSGSISRLRVRRCEACAGCALARRGTSTTPCRVRSMPDLGSTTSDRLRRRASNPRAARDCRRQRWRRASRRRTEAMDPAPRYPSLHRFLR